MRFSVTNGPTLKLTVAGILLAALAACESSSGDDGLIERQPDDVTIEAVDDETVKVIVKQELVGLRPEMVDWWWDNIDTTERYMMWHPTAHISFKWLVEPDHPDDLQYSVGAVQEVVEFIGEFETNLVIGWLNPEEAAGQVIYEHWLYGSTALKSGESLVPAGTLLHEYASNEAGDGIVMQSTFVLPTFANAVFPGFTDALAQHALEEMKFLPDFLPTLFQDEFVDAQGSPES